MDRWVRNRNVENFSRNSMSSFSISGYVSLVDWVNLLLSRGVFSISSCFFSLVYTPWGDSNTGREN